MNRAYNSPTLVEYGRIDQVTLGSTGNKADATVSLNTLAITISSTNPTCTNNVSSGYCYSILP